MKKETVDYLNQLAIEFHRSSKSQISSTVQRAIDENFYLNRQIETLSHQLEKSIEMNKKSIGERQKLNQTLSVLEAVQLESAKKYMNSQKV